MEVVNIVNLLITRPTDKKILAVKRSPKDNIFGGMYALPGGKMEKNETILETAKRELFEEAGVELVDMEESPCVLSQVTDVGKTYNIGIYNASIADDKFKPADKDIVYARYIETTTLISSLKKHHYPADQIELLEQFFSRT